MILLIVAYPCSSLSISGITVSVGATMVQPLVLYELLLEVWFDAVTIDHMGCF